MADLYTDLRALKMAMNGGQMPPMTPVPENVHHLIDPAFVAGLGALSEDVDKGLRCPVRGCGLWFDNLTLHLRRCHGPAAPDEVKRALSIPPTARLASLRLLGAYRRACRPPNSVPRGATSQTKRIATRRAYYASTGYRNLINRCKAQLAHQLCDMSNSIGRTPSEQDAVAMRGVTWLKHVKRVYGTWNNAVAVCGLPPRRHTAVSRERALESLAAWHETHGSLPTWEQVKRNRTAPVMPHPTVIASRLGTDSWPEAMRRAAALLNIYGGRYGLPESVRPKPKQEAA